MKRHLQKTAIKNPNKSMEENKLSSEYSSDSGSNSAVDYS